MEALQQVFDTIKAVLEIIKNFLADIFPQKDEAEGEDANA